MKRFLLDANVVLDVLLNRQPYVAESGRLWQLADRGEFEACLASFSLPTIHYVCRRQAGLEIADAAVDACLAAFEICALYRECIIAARTMPGRDFEDNLQVACAITDFVHGIVTRNPTDFAALPIQVYRPSDLLALLS